MKETAMIRRAIVFIFTLAVAIAWPAHAAAAFGAAYMTDLWLGSATVSRSTDRAES
jgi:hypothetical protein